MKGEIEKIAEGQSQGAVKCGYGRQGQRFEESTGARIRETKGKDYRKYELAVRRSVERDREGKDDRKVL